MLANAKTRTKRAGVGEGGLQGRRAVLRDYDEAGLDDSQRSRDDTDLKAEKEKHMLMALRQRPVAVPKNNSQM